MANLKDLTNLVAAKMDITKKDAEAAIKATFEAITEQMVAGEIVRIPNFGTFEKNEKEARMARNPQTGEPIEVPAHGAPRFKASSILKDALK